MPPIDRGFRRIAWGLVHYREAGWQDDAPPLLMIHGGPGSSAGLSPMIGALAIGRRVIAPDLMGNGDSDPPPDQGVTIVFHAQCVAALLDELGLERVDVYGHHSGAQIACELAIAHPARVRRLVLDGIALFPEAFRRELLERYAPPLVPAGDGRHLQWLWDFAAQLTQHFPHYARDGAHRLSSAAPLPPPVLTTMVAEVLKVWPTWHLLYRAAFSHHVAARLPLVTAATCVMRIAEDPLARYAEDAVGLLPNARLCDATRNRRVAELLRLFA